MSVSKNVNRSVKLAPKTGRTSITTATSASSILERRNQRSFGYKHLDRLATSEKATVIDWTNVHVRVYLGVIASTEYYVLDADIQRMFAIALHSLHLSAVRASLTGDYGLTVTEEQTIREAYEIVDQFYELLSLEEMKYLVKVVKAFYDNIARLNRQSVMNEQQVKQDTLNELASEYAKVKNGQQ